ncbi:MAG: bifunctional (p)ppGpp synthetase/guanosine-3',5'-bis(diphosphate) 3'-pyrophosphohydrolase [Pseudomonadota bacterium]
MLRQYELVERVKEYAPDADEALLNRAYVFSVQRHGSQKRASGDPYFSHPIEVAGLMTDLKLGEETIVTALLHDTVEDTLTTVEEIDQLFGPEIAGMVDGVTKLSRIEAQTADERAAENLRKFLLAMSNDLRVLLVKLADRLHNMRTLHFIKSAEKRKRIARETMDIYAPLAERVGMYEYMREMQLLSFEQLEPNAYATIVERLEQIKQDGSEPVDNIAESLQQVLADEGLQAKVSGREKHPYSIWRKMAERQVSFEQMTDIMAFRVVTANEEDCYRALGIIHRKWNMIPGRFKDYISTPKRNGYRSLHTAIIYGQSMRVEIQIRSEEMHRESEFGLAAHWAYKQGGARPDGQAGWIRDLLDILENADDADELLEHTRMAMYQDRIFAFSPKGALHQLPRGATAVDFAYSVHTDLGDQAVGARVNGRTVPLRTQLDNGDIVEILKSEGQEPQPGWLNFVVTGKARAAIRRFVRHKEREEIGAIGRMLYDEICERLPGKIGKKAMKAAIKRLNVEDEDALMHAIGTNKISDRDLMEALVPGSTSDTDEGDWRKQNRAISIRGLTPGVAYELAQCCHPVPGDRIVGLRQPGQPVQVHTIDCMNLVSGIDADWVDLAWDARSIGATARLRLVLHNRPGTLAEVTGIFSHHQANIMNLRLVQRDEPFHSFEIDLEVQDVQHLMRIIAALRASDASVETERI